MTSTSIKYSDVNDTKGFIQWTIPTGSSTSSPADPKIVAVDRFLEKFPKLKLSEHLTLTQNKVMDVAINLDQQNDQDISAETKQLLIVKLLEKKGISLSGLPSNKIPDAEWISFVSQLPDLNQNGPTIEEHKPSNPLTPSEYAKIIKAIKTSSLGIDKTVYFRKQGQTVQVALKPAESSSSLKWIDIEDVSTLATPTASQQSSSPPSTESWVTQLRTNAADHQAFFKLLDANGDNSLSDEEIAHGGQILEKAKKLGYTEADYLNAAKFKNYNAKVIGETMINHSAPQSPAKETFSQAEAEQLLKANGISANLASLPYKSDFFGTDGNRKITAEDLGLLIGRLCRDHLKEGKKTEPEWDQLNYDEIIRILKDETGSGNQPQPTQSSPIRQEVVGSHQETSPSDKKVAWVGDSIMCGIDSNATKDGTAKEGIAMTGMDSVLKRAKDQISSLKPGDVLVVTGGHNNPVPKTDKQAFKEIVDAAQRKGVKVVLVLPIVASTNPNRKNMTSQQYKEYKTHVNEIRTALEALAKKNSAFVKTVDAEAIVSNTQRSNDGLHPTQAGYDLLRQAVLKEIQEFKAMATDPSAATHPSAELPPVVESVASTTSPVASASELRAEVQSKLQEYIFDSNGTSPNVFTYGEFRDLISAISVKCGKVPNTPFVSVTVTTTTSDTKTHTDTFLVPSSANADRIKQKFQTLYIGTTTPRNDPRLVSKVPTQAQVDEASNSPEFKALLSIVTEAEASRNLLYGGEPIAGSQNGHPDRNILIFMKNHPFTSADFELDTFLEGLTDESKSPSDTFILGKLQKAITAASKKQGVSLPSDVDMNTAAGLQMALEAITHPPNTTPEGFISSVLNVLAQGTSLYHDLYTEDALKNLPKETRDHILNQLRRILKNPANLSHNDQLLLNRYLLARALGKAATANLIRGSRAAGWYQILARTWKKVQTALRKNPNEIPFTKENQKQVAVFLCLQAGITLDMLKADPEKAMHLAAWEWASFPKEGGGSVYTKDGTTTGGSQQRSVPIKNLLKRYQNALSAERAKKTE